MSQPPTPSRTELLDLYHIAIDEYHFTVTLAWSRTQYFLAFNVGILTAGTALLTLGSSHVFSVIVFVVGLVAAVLSIRAVQVSHHYFRATRDRVRSFETELGLPGDLRFNTTSGFADRPRPRINVNVTVVVYMLLGVLASADVAGAVAALMP